MNNLVFLEVCKLIANECNLICCVLWYKITVVIQNRIFYTKSRNDGFTSRGKWDAARLWRRANKAEFRSMLTKYVYAWVRANRPTAACKYLENFGYSLDENIVTWFSRAEELDFRPQKFLLFKNLYIIEVISLPILCKFSNDFSHAASILLNA